MGAAPSTDRWCRRLQNRTPVHFVLQGNKKGHGLDELASVRPETLSFLNW
jgi:hypothetical protein